MKFIEKYKSRINDPAITDGTWQDVGRLTGTYFLTWIFFEVFAGFLYPVVITWWTIHMVQPKSINGLSVLIEPRDVFLACGAFLFARVPDFLFPLRKIREKSPARKILASLFFIVGSGAISAAIYARIDEITHRGYGMPVVSAWWFAILITFISTLLISWSMALKAYEDRGSDVNRPSSAAIES